MEKKCQCVVAVTVGAAVRTAHAHRLEITVLIVYHIVRDSVSFLSALGQVHKTVLVRSVGIRPF